MRQPDGMEEIKITAPTEDTCPVCATRHDPRDPHDRNSLYYQNRFYRENGRFPTWRDAMRHCSPVTQAVFTEKLRKKGILADAEDTEPDHG